MNFSTGHFFYIAGLIVILVVGLSLLLLKNLNILFEGRYSNPKKVRTFWGSFCFMLFLVGTAALVFNWSKINPMERIDWATFPVYPGAKDVQTIPLVEGSAHANELYFKAEAEYPSTLVLDYYSKQITDRWASCTSDSEDWQKFGDVSSKTPQYIHQIRRYWVDLKKKRLMLLAIRYYSKGADSREKPDTNIQNVYLTEYEDNDLQQTTTLLKLKCEPKKTANTNNRVE
jgi:hypothetical protein